MTRSLIASGKLWELRKYCENKTIPIHLLVGNKYLLQGSKTDWADFYLGYKITLNYWAQLLWNQRQCIYVINYATAQTFRSLDDGIYFQVRRWGTELPFNKTGVATRVTDTQWVHLCLTGHTVERSRNFRDVKAGTATVTICSNNHKLQNFTLWFPHPT